MKQFELVISPTGESQLETQGYSGAECLIDSQFLEVALGRTLSDRKTAAYYQTETTNPNQLHEEQ